MNRLRVRIPALIAAVSVLLMLAVLAAPTALAAWSAGANGAAGAAAATMPAGAAPTAVASVNNVSLRWPAVALSDGAPVAGYVIQRIDALNGAPGTVGPGCSGVVVTTTCTELAVPSGTWIYADTPVLLTWSGAVSPPSSSVTVP